MTEVFLRNAPTIIWIIAIVVMVIYLAFLFLFEED